MNGNERNMNGNERNINLHTTGVHYLGGVSFFKAPKKIVEIVDNVGGGVLIRG